MTELAKHTAAMDAAGSVVSERDHFRDLADRWERRAMENRDRWRDAEAVAVLALSILEKKR